MKIVTVALTQEPVTVIEPTNRIVVIDCSGSMSSELPKLRTHLKNKLPTMVQPQDTLSIVWFSGRGQYGVLCEGMKLDSAIDLANVNASIDRFLKPVGMTAFVQPLQEVIEMSKRLTGPCSLSFMSDGYDNGYTKKEILKVCAALSDVLSGATFVEYGYYADHKLLTDMAEEVSGSVILAEDFQSYSEKLESSFKSTSSTKKIKVHKIKSEFVVGNQVDGFVIARPDAVGTVTLPANVLSYTYLEGTGDIDSWTPSKESVYMVSALIQRGKADLALQLAALIGDEVLYNQVQNSFSKQDYAITVDVANNMASGKTALYATSPKNNNLVQDPNAYNVLTLLMDLASEDGNYLHISHPEFKYNAIGEKRDTVETDGYIPKFKDTSVDVKAKIATLKFNEDRPNVSLLVRREGAVNLPVNDFGFDSTINTFIWRNYTIVKDGIVNLKKLPVILSRSTYDLFTQLGVISEPFKVNHTYVIDLRKYPVINRSMTSVPDMATFCEWNFDLYKLQVAQKYLKTNIDKPETGQKFSSLYGEDGALFLKEIGVTEGGFSPKTVKGESMDPYMAKVLEVKLSSLSSIPKVEDVLKAIASGKTLTPSQQVMKDVIDAYNGKDHVVELDRVKLALKNVLDMIIKTKFGIIIGKVWFPDSIGFEDNTRELDLGLSKTIKFTIELNDKAA